MCWWDILFEILCLFFFFFFFFSLCVATELQTMKVFNKKKSRAADDLCLCRPPRGRRTMGSSHLPLGALHFTGAMKRQRQLSAGQSNYTNSWLAALLSLARSPSPSLCLSASICPPFLCASLTQTGSPRVGPAARWYYRDNLRLLTPSPATNIYCAALIYSGLISES